MLGTASVSIWNAILGVSLKLKLCGALVAIGLVATPAASFAEDLTFVLTNASSYAVKSFFTSPAEIGDWEEDVFGENYLPSGNQVNVTIGDGREQCTYDLKFVLEDNSELVENGINLCELGEYTLTDAQ